MTPRRHLVDGVVACFLPTGSTSGVYSTNSTLPPVFPRELVMLTRELHANRTLNARPAVLLTRSHCIIGNRMNGHILKISGARALLKHGSEAIGALNKSLYLQDIHDTHFGDMLYDACNFRWIEMRQFVPKKALNP